jgi:hypothetical protein
VSDAQNPGKANTTGQYEAGVQRAEDAIALLSIETPTLKPGERLDLLYWAKWAAAQCLVGAGQWDEAIARYRDLEPLLVELQRFPEFKSQADERRVDIQMAVGATLISAARPAQALEECFRPFLTSPAAQTTHDESAETDLRNLICTHDNSAIAYRQLKRFDLMLSSADEAVRIAELLVRRFPRNARYSWGRAFSWAQQGQARICVGCFTAGADVLKKARDEIDRLMTKDAENDQFRQCRAIVSAIQAGALSVGSTDSSVSLAERLHRLLQAEAYATEAEQFCRETQAKEPETFLTAAHLDLAEARSRLHSAESDYR